MQHHLRALILLSVIVWQAAAWLGAWSAAQGAGALKHLVVHQQDANHHHADAALHMEDDGSPLQHLHADTGSSPAGLLPAPPPALASARALSVPEMRPFHWLSPTLEGLLRPPMLRAW